MYKVMGIAIVVACTSGKATAESTDLVFLTASQDYAASPQKLKVCTNQDVETSLAEKMDWYVDKRPDVWFSPNESLFGGFCDIVAVEASRKEEFLQKIPKGASVFDVAIQ